MNGREKRVLALLLKGMSNREIAGEMGSSEQTVKNDLGRIYAYFGIATEHGRSAERRLFPIIDEIRTELLRR